jgi:hypothetical protein
VIAASDFSAAEVLRRAGAGRPAAGPDIRWEIFD